MKMADNYPDGVCPDCGEDIPDDAVNGDECNGCGHCFFQMPTDSIEFNITVVVSMDECSATIKHGETTREALAVTVPELMTKIGRYVKEKVNEAGIPD